MSSRFSENNELCILADKVLNEFNIYGIDFIDTVQFSDISNWISTAKTVIKCKPNMRCICGSGIKYKKCCKNKGNNLRSNIKYELDQINTEAARLYNIVLSQNLKLLNPIEYIEKQDINRAFFNKLNKFINSLSDKKSIEEIKNTITYKYLEYLYNNYPSGMGNIMTHNKLMKRENDMVDVYYNLKKHN
jgi:hypothetical protein